MCRLQRDPEPYDVVIIVGKLGQFAMFSACREGRVGSGRGCGRDSTDLTQLQGSFLVS